MRTGVPCNENRFFPVRIDLQGVPCKPYKVWVYSVADFAIQKYFFGTFLILVHHTTLFWRSFSALALAQYIIFPVQIHVIQHMLHLTARLIYDDFERTTLPKA